MLYYRSLVHRSRSTFHYLTSLNDKCYSTEPAPGMDDAIDTGNGLSPQNHSGGADHMKKHIRTIVVLAVASLTLGAASYALASKACCVEPEVNNCCNNTAPSSCCR